MDADRQKWNASWRTRGGELAAPARFLLEHEALLPRTGRALDVAGGVGRHAVWLTLRGLQVTLIDVADAAVEQAHHHAAAAGVEVTCQRVDLDSEPLPPGPFDLVLCVHFLDRDHRDELATVLAPGGLLVVVVPTVHNLERHPRPSRRFCVEAGEVDAWIRRLGLEIVVLDEGWNADGRHEAALIARRL